MKIEKIETGTKKITISRIEWEKIGKQADWDPTSLDSVTSFDPQNETIKSFASRGPLLVLSGKTGSGRSTIAEEFAKMQGLSFSRIMAPKKTMNSEADRKAMVEFVKKIYNTHNAVLYWSQIDQEVYEGGANAVLLNALDNPEFLDGLTAHKTFIIASANKVADLPQRLAWRFNIVNIDANCELHKFRRPVKEVVDEGAPKAKLQPGKVSLMQQQRQSGAFEV